MFKALNKRIIFFAIVQFFALSTCYSAQKLPQLANINHIEIRSPDLDSIVISDPKKLFKIVSFFNKFQGGWPVPLDSLPKSSLTFLFHSDQGLTTELGISNNSVSRIYGEFWHQPVGKNIIKKFAGSIHPAIEETLFPIIPIRYKEKDIRNRWQHKLKDLKSGASHQDIKSFIKKHNFRITQVNNYRPEEGYWLKLKLSLINEGEYVDTVLAAKLFLNKDHSLKETKFLGYQLSKKPDQKKIITTNINASSY